MIQTEIEILRNIVYQSQAKPILITYLYKVFYLNLFICYTSNIICFTTTYNLNNNNIITFYK